MPQHRGSSQHMLTIGLDGPNTLAVKSPFSQNASQPCDRMLDHSLGLTRRVALEQPQPSLRT